MLKDLFSSNTRARLIIAFFAQPNRTFYQAELLDNESLSVIQYELKKLTVLGIIETFSDHKKRYYILNKKHYLYPEMRKIVIKVKDRENPRSIT